MSLYARSACDKRQERQLIKYYLSRSSRPRFAAFFFMYKRFVLESHDGPKEERATREKEIFIYIYILFSLTSLKKKHYRRCAVEYGEARGATSFKYHQRDTRLTD